jgi:hypothetical protein
VIRIPRLAPAGGAVLLAFALSACSGAPTDASKSEFCASVSDRSWYDEIGDEPDAEAIVDGLESWGADLEEVGTPEDIDDDAREGFEITVEYLADLDPDDFEELSNFDPSVSEDLSEDEREKVEALNAYVDETCVPESPDVPEHSIS